MWAGKNKLDNLTAIIDRNNIQIDGFPRKTSSPLEPLGEKFQAFGWHVIEINGNDIRQIYDAIFQARAIFEKPNPHHRLHYPRQRMDFREQDF